MIKVVHAGRFHNTLYGRVLIATAIGVLLGHFWPEAGVMMKPLGDGQARQDDHRAGHALHRSRRHGRSDAVTNLIGNGVATIVIGKWCGQTDGAVDRRSGARTRRHAVRRRRGSGGVVNGRR